MSETKLDPNLAGILEVARQRAGLSKYRLAIRAGVSLQTCRTACQGIATLRTLTLLARALGITVDDLTGRKGGAA